MIPADSAHATQNIEDKHGSDAAYSGQSSRWNELTDAKQQMLARGWCTHQVDHLARAYDVETVQYLSTLAPGRQADHNACHQMPNCIAYNVDNDTYQTRHTSEGCVCQHVEIPYKQLIACIRSGRIPLVSIEDGALRVHERSRRSKYIAITHVWADGLGNPKACALPRCQLTMLNDSLVKAWELPALTGDQKKSRFSLKKQPRKVSPLFWMDTLCIPVRKADKALRLIQIDKMASIYKGAVASLVLDAELMTTALQTRTTARSHEPVPGVFARIACSAWMSRSWTYQEAQLPKALIVQFARGRLMYLDERVTQCSSHEGNQDQGTTGHDSEIAEPSSLGVSLEQVSSYGKRATTRFRIYSGDLKHNIKSFPPHFLRFSSVWNELSGRSTTQARDVPLIVSNVLNLENRDLLTYDEPEQMYQAIILSQDWVPIQLFFNTGPRYRQDSGRDRNRWVPTTISKDSMDGSLFSRLKVCRSYFVLDDWPGIKDRDIYVLSEGLQSNLGIHLAEEETYCLEEPQEILFNSQGKRNPGQICLFLESARQSSESSPPGVRRGAYFTVERRGSVNVSRNPFRRHSGHRDVWELVFQGPLRFRTASPAPNSESRPTVAPHRLNTECEIRILYDLLPKVRPLRRRSRETKLGGFFLICAILLSPLVAFGGAIVGGIEVSNFVKSRTAGFGVFCGICVAVYFIFTFGFMSISSAAYSLDAWRDIRAFENVVRKKERNGEDMA